MYLKALEIQGFKSFPEKTRLTFEKDITAIVGPNGSGKSNISDAIRWVMGEQSSRTLRGGRMEDVIFGGTEKRNQVGFAEVSLILDNSRRIFNMDNTEVMITRRYYRSGESEHYINRESRRLRDVNEILMDTGMGRDGYAIIDQGKIAEILSLKSVDRRDIFEEAAGISRFRHRKEESERKLQKTDENLTRINDKIAELEMQVEPLREQSETAKKYLILRDELRETEISLWLENLDKLRAQSIKLSADWEAAKDRLEDEQTQLEEIYKKAENFSEKMRDCDLEAENVRENISETELKAAEVKNELTRLETGLAANMSSIERMTDELSEHDGRTSTLQGQISEREERIGEIEAEREKLFEHSEELMTRMGELTLLVGDKSGELEGLLNNERQETLDNFAKRERLSALLSSVQEWLDRDGTLAEELGQARIKLEEVISGAEETGRELEKAEEEADSLSNMIKGYTLRLKSRGEKVREQNQKVLSLTMEYEAVKSRINMLSDMEREYQGYSKAVRLVMQESVKLKNIHGPVANLVEADDEYALAIETALGGAAQNIIVGTPEDGKYAINFLKRRDGGRATFLPISAIKGQELREKGLMANEGFIGLAADLVRYDRKYENIYKNLLGRTVIVHNIDDAIKISKAYGNRFKIVTLDGQVMSAGGSMTGGSAARGTGIISRANEIKKLKVKRSEMADRLTEMRADLERAEIDLKSESGQLESSQNELRQLEDQVLKLTSGKETHELLKTSVEDSCRNLEREIDQIKDRLETGDREIKELQEAIAVHEANLRDFRDKADAISAGREDLKSRRDELSKKQVEIQAADASLRAEREAAEKSIRELRELSGSLTGDRELKSSSISELSERNEAIRGELARNETESRELEERLGGYKRELSEITGKKLLLEAERTTWDRESKEKNRAILDMERESSRLEQKRAASDMEEKQILDKLWDTYELSHSAAAIVRRPLESIAAANREVTRIKRDINALGTPNIGAIEEFERVNTRYTYLTEQRDDVETAKRELIHIIDNITKEMKEIFAREFKNIDRSFRETFTELFGGGKAALELEDEDDILGCGIEIHVQPPGKSLKTITLLSGGEKSFVAIALYFAIQKIRPTPFCVMDEIEAALDEANVLRFAEYMRSLSHRTQFVVITHRRGTMEEADILYGVTMQERGVSKVISVDLEEAERTIS